MRISFRQGLVRVGPSFLSVSAGSVSLNTTDSPLVAIISAGSKDYLWVEPQSITNAWTGIGSQNTWLYIDVNARTAARTFGSTTIAPIVSSTAPSTQTGKHWYDSTANQMKVWSGTAWQPKTRVFVAKLANGSVAQSLSINSPVFTGTQVGDTTEVFAGQILFDLDDQPIKQSDGRFATTEDRLRTRVLSTAEIKLASVQLEAAAGENLAKYTIVIFSDFGVIEHATLFSPSMMGQFGIIERDILTGQLINVVTSGVVTNPDWDWTTTGINRPLFCTSSGTLATTEQIPGQNPVAVIVDRHSIQLGSPQVSSGQVASTVATGSQLGYVRLSTPATNPVDPIAVGTNDSRLSNARTPTAHTHVSADITDISAVVTDQITTELTDYVRGPATSIADEFARFNGTTGKIIKGGLTLSTTLGNTATAVPTEAAVKTYVDSRPIGTGDVVGPASSVADDIARFSGTTGKLIKAGLSVTTSTSLAGNSNLAIPTEAAVKAYVDSRPTGTGDVVGPASSVADNLVQFSGTTGKLVKGGLAITTSTTLAGNSDTNIPSEKAVKAYVDANLGTAGAGGSGAGDLYFNSVSLLLHANGTNGSTTFTDASLGALVPSAIGTPTISTTQKVFGTGSLVLNGSTDALSYPHTTALNLATSDFTIEAWIYIRSYPSSNGACIVQKDQTFGSSFPSYSLRVSTLGGVSLEVGTGANSGYNQAFSSSTGIITLNTWYHVAAVRTGTTVRIFVNGTQVATGTQTGTSNDGGKPMLVGRYPAGGGTADAWVDGYIDDLRITKGVARYLSNFTAPTVTFADSALADTSGPSSAVANNFVTFNGTTGKMVKDSGLALTTSTTLAGNSDTNIPSEKAVKAYVDTKKQAIPIAISDETTAITAGVAKVTFRMPFAFTLTGIRASLTTAQTSGSIFTVNVKESGTTILSTKLTIDNTEKTSTTAVTAPVISDSSIADDAEITVDIDQVGDGTAKGLKVYLIGYPS